MPHVEFENIVKRFGSFGVLEDLNLKVHDGEFLVLLGPSGCGKTTLLNLLAGLMDVTSGTIRIGGQDVTDFEPRDRGLAMVFQSYALYPTKTVAGNLRFGLASQKLAAEEMDRRVAWAAQLLQIQPLMHRKPAQLSGGQRQRVAIGRALVKHSGVLLFDEPLSNLDAKLRTEMRLEIKKLHQELNQTIVYVTHDQIEAMTMATRIAVMDRGVIQQIGSPDEIYERPANMFVARFIGTPAINMLAARISNNGTSATLATGSDVDLHGYQFQVVPEIGKSIMLGIRPEYLLPAGEVKTPSAKLSLPVRYAERTGSEATVFLEYGNELMAMKTDPSRAMTLRSGTTVELSVGSEGLNVFDAQTGLRL